MLLIGSTVKPYGKVVMIKVVDGERYYWLKHKSGSISMIPYFVIEPEYENGILKK